MLYEKTLSRKVVSISSAPQENGAQNGVKKEETHGPWSKAVEYLLMPYRAVCGQSRSKAPKKDLATMGKILNLMRYVANPLANKRIF